MNKFRKTPRQEVPTINTASLPDLIFTLLFFFMLVTNLREPEILNPLQLPYGTEIREVTQKNLITFLYLSRENNTDSVFIQVDNQKIAMDELNTVMERIKDKLPADQQDKMTVVLKIDKTLKMAVVGEVKNILSGSGIRIINYALEKEPQ